MFDVTLSEPPREAAPQAASSADAQRERRAFWAAIYSKGKKPKRSAAMLLEGRRRVALQVLRQRERGRRNPPDAWRYFDALAITHTDDEGALALANWATRALPELAAQVGSEILYRRAVEMQGRRLTNAQFGQLLRVTIADRKAYRLNRRFVTEIDWTPVLKAAETRARKARRRKADEKRRRAKGIKPRPAAPWRVTGMSKRFYYRLQRKLHGEPILPSLEQLVPWEREGMTRATWFRRPVEWRENSVLRCLPEQLRCTYLERPRRGHDLRLKASPKTAMTNETNETEIDTPKPPPSKGGGFGAPPETAEHAFGPVGLPTGSACIRVAPHAAGIELPELATDGGRRNNNTVFDMTNNGRASILINGGTAMDGIQLGLFAALPDQTDGAIETLRELARSGRKQTEIAALVGVRNRSHIANVLRGHDRLSPARRRLLRHRIETERVAA